MAAASDDAFGVLDLVQESVLILDLEGRIAVWNTASETLYGWPRALAIGKDACVLLCADPTTYDAAQRVFLATDHWEGEVLRRARDGRSLTVDVERTLRRDENGAPVHIVECGRDLTAKKEEEARYRHIEHRYTNLFQALAASIWEVDFAPIDDVLRELLRDGVTDFRAHFEANPKLVRRLMSVARVIDVNDRTVALFGRGDKAEILGPSDRFWAEGSEPVFAAGVLAGIAKKAGYASEVQLRSIDGRVFDALMTISYPPATLGRGTLVVGIIDLSEQKRADAALRISEKRYRALFHDVPTALAQVDVTGMHRVFEEARARGVTDLVHYVETDPDVIDRMVEGIVAQEVNDHACKLFGVEREEELLGPIAWCWRGAPARATLRRSLAARLRGATSFTEQTTLTAPDGHSVDVLYFIAFSSELAELGMNVIAMVDIRERVRAEGMLEQMQAEFAHSARVSMLGELTASIAHEINQPLTAVISGSSATSRWLDRDPPLLDEAKAALGRVRSDARRAADIIARVRSMVTKDRTEQLDTPINVVVEDAVQFLRHESAARGVPIVLDLDASSPRTRVDRIQIQQVIVNLAVNAMQAMSRMPRRDTASGVTIRTIRLGDFVQVGVEDSGPGISDEDAAGLFQSFFTTKPGGMGMGLRISRSIIEAHDGTIDAKSRPEGGAAFAFTLPACR